MHYKNSLIILLILMFTLNVASAEWFNTTGTDHNGADWTPADASDISGRHYNIGTFTITSGYTVNIGTGIELEVFAETIHVYGTLDGDGHGATGTGNGGTGGSDNSGGGGGGGAGYGGNGAVGKAGQYGAAGSAGSLFGDTTTKIISMGSTGGTGGTNSGGSGTGGLGGASVLLYGDNVIIPGTITCDGIAGSAPGEGGGGGGGSGGGILIIGRAVFVNGSLSVDGGNGGNSGIDGDGAGGGGAGGRIKIVNSSNILNNWFFEDWSAGPSNDPDAWVGYNSPSVTQESTTKNFVSYSASITSTSTSSRLANIYESAGTVYSGKNMTLGAMVWSSHAGTCIALQYSGTTVYSDYHSGSGSWEWLTVQITNEDILSNKWVMLYPDKLSGSGSAYFDTVVLIEGDTMYTGGAGVYTTGISTSITGGTGGTGTTGVADNGAVGTYNSFNTSSPSTPTVIIPTNNSNQGSSPVTLNVTATDTDGDSIQYYYYGNTGDGSTYLSNSSSYYDWSIGSNTYFWKARAHDGFMYSDYILLQTFTSFVPPVLYTPSNTSTQYTTFPPLIDSVSFTWQDLGASQYRLMVAEDVNFNVMAVDTYVGTNNSNQDLLVNIEYFWKVYAYDGISYSNTSDVYQFNLTGNSTLTGSAIEGVCYSDIGGTYTALLGTEVTIWNETWTDTAITGSNGYYLFTGVADGEVYSIQAKKDLYLDSSIALVNATADPITQNFFLLPDRTSEEWRHYVKFVVWGPAGYYEGVTVTVYENSDVTALYTADTGNDGAVTFIMDRQQEYRVTFIDAGQGINREMILYPKDDKYLIFVASTGSWSTYDEPVDDVIGIDVSTEIINSTHAYVNVSYTDTMSETTAATVYLNQTNSSDPYNQTVIDSQAGHTNNWTHSFIVSDYEGESYFIHVVATHTTYGTIDQTYAVQFDDDVGLPGLPDKMWLYVAILIMMFTAGMFGASTATEGAAIICVEGWVFLFFGWFSSINSNDTIAIGLGFATVVAIIANINKFSKKEGHE